MLLELWERSRRRSFFITHDVDEALALGDRILVVVHGRIALEEELTTPRPRSVADLAGEESSALRQRVLEHLELGARSA